MFLSTQDVAERYGVSKATVLGWIEEGLLTAVNVSPAKSAKKRFRVSQDALASFEVARQTGAPRKPTNLPKCREWV